MQVAKQIAYVWHPNCSLQYIFSAKIALQVARKNCLVWHGLKFFESIPANNLKKCQMRKQNKKWDFTFYVWICSIWTFTVHFDLQYSNYLLSDIFILFVLTYLLTQVLRTLRCNIFPPQDNPGHLCTPDAILQSLCVDIVQVLPLEKKKIINNEIVTLRLFHYLSSKIWKLLLYCNNNNM